MKRGGDSGQSFTADMVDADAFHDRVDRTRPCWLWTGPVNAQGYGQFSVPALRRGPVAAHRVAFVLDGRELPNGALVLHSCENPPCCNPWHLRLGTAADNVRDMIERNRGSVVGGVKNKNKTHCKHGHPFNAENTVLRMRNGSSRRECRECQRVWARENQTKKPAGSIEG